MIVDKLCEVFDKIRLPDVAGSAGTEPNSINLFDLARSVQWIVGDERRKRKSVGGRRDDSDDESSASAPSNDIYRKRQQKKIK